MRKNIHLRDQFAQFPIIVAKISEECILGADFLHNFKALPDTDKYTVRLILPNQSVLVLNSIAGPRRLPYGLVRVMRVRDMLHDNARTQVVLFADPGSGRNNRWTHQIEPIRIHTKQLVSILIEHPRLWLPAL